MAGSGVSVAAKPLQLTALKVCSDIVMFATGAIVASKALALLFLVIYNTLAAKPVPYSLAITTANRLKLLPQQKVLEILVVAPLFETAVFIVLIWKLMPKAKRHPRVFIAVSTLAFAALHIFVGLGSSINALIIGIFFASLFLKYEDRSPTVVAYWIVSLTHSLYNLLATFV